MSGLSDKRTSLIRTAILVIGANTTAPFGSCATSAGHSTNASVSLFSASGDLVLAATAKGYATETVTAGSSQAQKWNVKSLGVPDTAPPPASAAQKSAQQP